MTTCTDCGQVNRVGARFCDACGAPLAAEAIPVGELRKTVTAVFCDLVGSTPLVERLDPEVLRRVMTRYFGEMRFAVEQFGGEVEKFIGDAVVGVFGLPRLHEDDAFRAVQAACEMRERLALVNDALRPWDLALEVRIGIATGEVAVGRDGDLPLGDVMNTAARLEQTAGPGEILVAASTHRLVSHAVNAESVGGLELKGKRLATAAWRIRGVDPDAGTVIRALDRPLVGRERELGWLRQAYQRAVDGQGGRLVTVLGFPGIGKSRLALELAGLLAGEARVLVGHCRAYGDGITYGPVAEMVRAALGDEVTGRLMELLEREPDGERIAVLVAATVGEAEPSADDQETVWAIRRFFEALDPGRPLMLVFDDVHWAVPTLLDLIEHLAAGVRGRPLFVLCLARTELLDARPGWAGQGSSLRLEPLTDDQAERMLDERLEDRALEPDVRRRIIRSSQGVPMFVEQMLALLDERRALRADDVPPAISALLAARLDALRGDERRALERASVEGELFHCGAVAALVDEPVGQVVRLLRGLEARELVRADDARLASEQGFRFTHALIRDAAYDRVSKADRAALHEQLAGWLEVHGAGDELVGYHLERAVRLGSELAPRDDRCRALARQAAGRLAAAGRRAHDRGDYKGGANLLERACDLLPDEDQDRIGMLPELGVLLSEVDVASAVPLLTQAIEQARTTENRRVEWESTVIRSRVLMYADPAARSPGDLLAEGERATAELEALGDDWGVASALILRADAHLMLGQLSHCYGLCLRAAAHGRGPVRTRALAMAAYGLCRGDTVAHDAEARCHELLKAAGEGRRARAFISSELGWSQALQGRIKEGRLLTRSARDELDELGVVAWLGSATLACGFVEQLAGDAVAAERHFAEAQQTFLELDDDWSLSEAVVNRALALCDLSRHTEALEVSKHPQVPHEPEWVINWNRVQALAIVAQGSPEPALAHAEVAVRTAEDTEYLNYHAAALADRASIHHLLGHPAAARADLKAALDLYGRKGNAVDARRIQERLTEPARS